jgi:hypothetical protein
LAEEDLKELDEFVKEHEKSVGPSSVTAESQGQSIVENKKAKSEGDSKSNAGIHSIFKQLAEPMDSSDSQILSESSVIPFNPYQIPDFDESKYTEDFMELREEAMKCKDLSYFPRCVKEQDLSSQ